MNLDVSPNLLSLPTKVNGVNDTEAKTPEIDQQREFVMEWKNILYMLAHDMKNPVTTAGGFLSRLFSGKYGSFTERQLDYLELIRDNLGKLARLIKLLIDYLKSWQKHIRTAS